jgi:hypothetical protein
MNQEYSRRAKAAQNQELRRESVEIVRIEQRLLSTYFQKLERAYGEKVVRSSCPKTYHFIIPDYPGVVTKDAGKCVFKLADGSLCKRADVGVSVHKEFCPPLFSGPACGKLKLSQEQWYVSCRSTGGRGKDAVLVFTPEDYRRINPTGLRYM